MQHSEWVTPTTEELHELEYTQIEEAAGGNNKNNTSVPINNGIWLVLLIVIIFGLTRNRWKQSHT